MCEKCDQVTAQFDPMIDDLLDRNKDRLAEKKPIEANTNQLMRLKNYLSSIVQGMENGIISAALDGDAEMVTMIRKEAVQANEALAEMNAWIKIVMPADIAEELQMIKDQAKAMHERLHMEDDKQLN